MEEHAEGREAASNYQVAREVRRLSEEWVAAFVGRDTAALDSIMAEDFAFTYPLEGDDKEQFISDVASGEMTAEYLERENVTVRVYGETAVLTCRDSAKWRYRGRTITGIYKTLQVYARRAGRWQLVAVQSCPFAH